MSQIIENWSDIIGQVQEIGSYPDLIDFDFVDILVERVDPVEGYPDLVAIYLSEAPEPRLSVLMPAQLITAYHIETGVLIECRVRRAGPDRILVHRKHIIVRRTVE